MTTSATGPGSVDAVARMLGALPDLLADLLHDWQLVAEYDGAYALFRCGLCGTEVLR